ncbi:MULTISPECIES: HAMP domain-containing sensor histidine kinase [Paenibacillus]|uniref:histidine kinase n=1 Tax=Paenibacillus campinasensis TaxID=66347 RepID=A0A268EHR7_9BACL|nr:MULTISPECIES: HAMP domain-containing sensor histidine kinase [Paenibacillus]PAD72676.1 hypothetical protein CHH67_21690 [Paenibacillus campinasensis]PAK51106.1 hypothetical protein CHH75_15370 [Paenibacillus sp. 7541]
MNNKWFHKLNLRENLSYQILAAALGSAALALLVMSVIGSLLNATPYGFTFFYVPIFAFLGTFFLCFSLFTYRIRMYFHEITDGLKKIGDAKLDYRIPVTRKDELGEVALAMNRMAQQLQQTIERERLQEQIKMELITGLSHDVRTPLTSINAYLDLIRTESFKNRQEYQRFVDHACRKLEQLNKIVDHLFENTRLMNPNLRLSLQALDFQHLAEQIVHEFEPLANEKGLAVTTKWEKKNVIVSIDAEKLVRAIDNLLLNALKFSHRPGTINIRLYMVEDGYAVLEVENFGTPITKEDEQQLFNRFYQVSRHLDPKLPAGSGLGLSIVQNIVEQHGGYIAFEHNDGRFVFSILLPIAKCSSEHL